MPESRKVLNKVIGEWIQSKSREEVIKECEAAGVTMGPVYNMEDISKDRHVKERGTMCEVIDPVTGKTFSFPGSPFRLRHAPPRIQYPGLPMGGANDYVLQGLLGYPAGEVARMKEEKVI